MKGHEMKFAADPTAFVELPWNSFTYDQTVTTGTDDQSVAVTSAAIIAFMRPRLGLSETANLRIKVQTTKFWATARGPRFARPELRGQFYELAGQSSPPLLRSVIRDAGTMNQPARVGYEYPITDRKEVLNSAQNYQIAEAECKNSGTDVNFRVALLWQSSMV
jgi:hypothetical protein